MCVCWRCGVAVWGGVGDVGGGLMRWCVGDAFCDGCVVMVWRCGVQCGDVVVVQCGDAVAVESI